MRPSSRLIAGGNYLGKAWDDRIGCAVLLEAMRRTAALPHPNTLIYVATVQEEIGLRGGRTAAQTVKPDIGIALEGGITGDQPGARPEESQVKLGGGPGMFLYDSSTIPSRKLVAFTRRMAADAHIPLQADLVQGYGDDSAEMQMTNGGTPTINLVVPVRYTHSHNGIVNRADFDRTVDLVVTMLLHLDQAQVNDLRDFTPQALTDASSTIHPKTLSSCRAQSPARASHAVPDAQSERRTCDLARGTTRFPATNTLTTPKVTSSFSPR